MFEDQSGNEQVLLNYVQDLLLRMDDSSELPGATPHEHNSVAIEAHKEARALVDQRLLPLAIASAPMQRDQYQTCHVNHVIFHLGSKGSSKVAYDYMVDQLKVERRSVPLESLIEYIRKFPLFPDRKEEILQALLPHVGTRHYGVSVELLKTLSEFRDRRIVNACVSALSTPKYRPSQISFLLRMLAKQKDATVLPQVLRFSEDERREVRGGFDTCIAELGGSSYSYLLARDLKHKSDNIRSLAMGLLADVGDESVLNEVISYFKSVTKRRQVHEFYYARESKVVAAVRYLERFSESHTEADQALRFLAEKRWQLQWSHVQRHLATNFPSYFGHLSVSEHEDQSGMTLNSD